MVNSLSIFYFKHLLFYSVLGILTSLLYFSCSDRSTEPDDDGNNYSQVDDIDGNIYKTIIIGDQEWMLDNLKVKHFNNSDPIPLITNATDWNDMTSPACCGYENTDSLIEIYGLLYNWYAVTDTRDIAPEGWHIPTDKDWKQLELFLGMDTTEIELSGNRGTDQGGQLKESGLTHWKDYNVGATNSSGFSALPGGYRYYYGTFNNVGNMGTWWTGTERTSQGAWSRILSNTYASIFRADYPKDYGFSVRCIKD